MEAIIGGVIGLALLFLFLLFKGGAPSSACTGDCRQGRECTCGKPEKPNDDDDL